MNRNTNTESRARTPRLMTLAAIAMVLASLAPLATAQGGGGQGGGRQGGGMRGGPGGPGGGMRGGPGGGSIGRLVTRPDVAEELGLTESQLNALRTALDALRPPRPERGQGGGQDRPDPATMRAEMERRAAAEEAAVARILSSAQLARAEEIRVGLMGLGAAFDPKVQAKLNLSEAQKDALADLMPQRGPGGPGGPGGDRGGPGGPPPGGPDGGPDGGPGGRGPGGRGGPDDGRRADMEAKIAAILTADQKSRLKALAGKPFTPQMRGRGGPGGPGGQGNFDGPPPTAL